MRIVARSVGKKGTHLLSLARPLLNPLLGLLPGLVEREQTCLTATFDELIGFGDELGVEDPSRELGVGGDRVGLRVPGDLGDLGRRVDEVCGYCCGGRGWGRALEPVCEEELRIVLADGYMRAG